MKKKKKVVDSAYARGRGDYDKVIDKIAREGLCPFCPENFKYHRRPILRVEKGWILTTATWPYKDTRFHFLLISKGHKENFSELKLADWRDISALVNWTVKKYKLKGGGFTLRFGETKYTGATVCHLHAHVIVPKLNKKTGRAKPVYFPIG